MEVRVQFAKIRLVQMIKGILMKIGDVVNVYKGDDYFPSFIDVIIGEYCEEGIPHFKLRDSDTVRNIAQLKRRYTHISPSALKLWESNKDEFYMKYIARYRPPAIPQSRPMSVGSAFDAYAKAYINGKLSHGVLDDKYSFESLFIAQVEEQNRPWARIAGQKCFDAYCVSGAMAGLMLEIAQGDAVPQYEFDARGLVVGVLLAGKPDLYYKNSKGLHCIKDWKVNGYCSQAGPKPGYVKIRDGWKNNNSRSHNTTHKDSMVMMDRGMAINMACNMEDIDKDWATQLSCYAWLMGEPIGGDFCAGIEQLACDGDMRIRVASFRNKISREFQETAYNRFYDLHCKLQSGYWFDDLRRIDSDVKCAELEKMAQTLNPTGDIHEDWMNNLNRRW